MGRITTNVYLQDAGTPLLEFLPEIPAPGTGLPGAAINFVHVVNPFSRADRVGEQKIAFESMRQAGNWYRAQSAGGEMGQVNFIAPAFQEDMAFAAAEFETVVPLHRSSLDLGDFQSPRRLPLLRDLIGAGHSAAGNDDFLVYTNSDICVTPNFYSAVALLLRSGTDAITINRRTVEAYPDNAALLPMMAASLGSKHPGFDCFIFPAKWFSSFAQADVLTGMPGVARYLLYNMVAHAEKMVHLNSVHLTFHRGDDRSWQDGKFGDYKAFNYGETRKIVPQFSGIQQHRLRDYCASFSEPSEVSGISLIDERSFRHAGKHARRESGRALRKLWKLVARRGNRGAAALRILIVDEPEVGSDWTYDAACRIGEHHRPGHVYATASERYQAKDPRTIHVIKVARPSWLWAIRANVILTSTRDPAEDQLPGDRQAGNGGSGAARENRTVFARLWRRLADYDVAYENRRHVPGSVVQAIARTLAMPLAEGDAAAIAQRLESANPRQISD